jgi:hypothetical protein
LLNFEIYKKKRKRMKKMIKMSLVAAVAVAGLTSTASAANLADAIKDTKLTGYVRYRINTDHENDAAVAGAKAVEETKAVAKITTPVNDMVTANIKTVALADTASGSNGSDTKGQTVAPVNVTEGNFVVKAGGATVIAGLQTSQSPFFANNGDTRSHGVTALIPAGAMTIAAAHYTTTTVPVLTNEVNALGLIGKAGAVGFEAWYATVSDGGTVALDGASAMNVSVNADLGAAKVGAMMTTLTNGDNTSSLTKITASGKAGSISWMAGYAMTGDEAAISTGGRVSVDGDSDGKSDLSMHVLNMQATTDASAFVVSATVPVSESTSVTAAMLSGSEGDAGNDESFSEINVKAAYKMSKNFGASFTYATGEYNTADIAQSRICVKYTF